MLKEKKLLFIILFLSGMIFSLLFADLAMATGCCVDLQAKSCSTVASQDNCNTGSVLYFDEKSCTTEVSQCALGCCCPPAGTSVGSINISCEPPSTFFPSQVTPGAPCSCSGAGFSVSGSIQSTSGSSISRAFVSAKGVANYSKIDGSFILNNVDGGTNVIVAASKPGCAPSNITIANLASDASNINIQLNCQCTNESCNASANAYCVNSIWKFYDLTVEVHKAEYCNYCGPDDPDDCGSIICIDNNADCPVACSSNPEDINYDSDCVCSSTPNGVCPLGCTADNDADCNVYSPVCGDGIVTYPYETCEDTLAGSGQFSLCSANDCANLGEIGACNCKGISGCGDLVLAPTEACEIGMMCPNGVECEDCMCGPANCTAITMKPVLSSNFDSLSKKINLSWSTHSACAPSISSYSLFRCQKNTTVACSSPTQFNPIDASIPKFTTTYSDGPLSQNSEYCYYLNAYFITDTSKVGASQIKCTSTGNYYCMESHPPQFCMNNARKKCGANNNLETIEDCTPGGKHCMGPNDNGETKCVNQSICDSCNGLFGMFAHLDLNVTVEEGGYRVTKFCKENGRPERDLIEGCYIDRTLSLFNAFDYCANIASCYDYKSEAACTDPADPCAKNKICEWVWLNEDQHALGGLCRPTNPQLHKCEFCDSSQYNWLSPGCTPEVCKLFGSCYYQGTSSLISAQSCSKQSTASCLDYLIQQNCTGGQPVHVDATYNNTIRVGGTHQLAPASSDSLRLGKCYWTGLYCFRDADNNPINFITNTGRDCPIGDRYCEADFSSPTTTILPSGFGVYPATVNIKYTATDNYPSNLINTSFCIVSASNYCYPDELGRNSEYSKKLPVSGSYQIYYYSQDPAKNLEQVKNTTIRVDAEKPFIDLTSPSNASNFPTNLQIVPAQGITSTDSRYVCAKNTRNNQASCINNCVLTGQKQPCFSNDTGIFAISINIGNRTNFTDVLFYAEDFAGNTYSNTLLGILYDIEPPDEPIITIAPNR